MAARGRLSGAIALMLGWDVSEARGGKVPLDEVARFTTSIVNCRRGKDPVFKCRQQRDLNRLSTHPSRVSCGK